MIERWLPVPGYEGLYEVSDAGSVRSVPRVVLRSVIIPVKRAGKLLKGTPRQHHGDLKVYLCKNGRPTTCLVHRLVLLAFVGPCPPGYECLHDDGNPANNVLSNLHWGTPLENAQDMLRHGTNYCARKTMCRRGHLLLPPNLGRYSQQKGERNCLACMRGHADVRRAVAKGQTLTLQVAADRHYAKIMKDIA
jgi:hypothetical protein